MAPLPLLVALVLAAPARLPPDAPLEIVEAGEVSYEPGTGRWALAGGAVLRRGGVTLRATRATYDPRTGEVDASGGVLLAEPGRVLSASSLHAVLDGPFQARDVVAFTKEGPLDLARCRTLDDARATGRNRATVGGAVVSGRSGDPRIAVERPRVTLCDCGAGPPSWEVRASSATVVPDSHAWLTWPVFWITPRFLALDRPVPVLALPVVYLPLAERQSGLLLPELGFSHGFMVSQPLFLAPSESWDATVTADGAFGAPVAQLAGAADFQHRSVRGAGASLELRWAPAEATAGRARLRWVHDVARDCVARAPGGGCAPGALSPAHGERLALTALHEQRLGAATDLRVDLGLLNDPLFLADLSAGPSLLRNADYRTSSAWVARGAGDLVLAAEAHYHLPFVTELRPSTLGQQVLPVDPATGLARVPYGLFGSELPVFHRMPALTATLLPVRLAGPLALSGSASLSRFAPLRGSTGDEGADGIGPGGRGFPALVRDASGAISDRDAGERDGRWQPGERLAADRAAARLELRAPQPLGDWATLEPWAAGFAAGYAYETGPGPQANARVAGGVALSTRLTRAFGALRHDVEPRVEWRLGTPRLGPALAAPAWDELDAAPRRAGDAAPAGLRVKTLSAVPARSFQQASLALRNRLHAGATALDVVVGQDVDLTGGKLGEAWAQATVAASRLRLGATASLYPGDAPASAPLAGLPPGALPPSRVFDAFSFLGGSVALLDPHGDVHAVVAAMGPHGSQRLAAGLETLLDPDAPPVTPFADLTAGATLRLGGASVSYDLSMNPRQWAAPLVPGGSTAPHVYRHAVAAAWNSPCKCFQLGVGVSKVESNPISWSFQFGLGELAATKSFGP